MALEDIAGWIAAALTTSIFIPQIIKAFSTGLTRDISMMMLILAVLGNAAWLVQSILMSNTPLTVCAILIIIMSFILITFKYRNERT